jgi:hypothetical protein
MGLCSASFPRKSGQNGSLSKGATANLKGTTGGQGGVERGQCLKEQTGNPAQTEMSALGQEQTFAVQQPMSALGQKQTCAAQKGMSALPPIATAKADFRKGPCPLYSQERTCAVQ